MTVEVPVGQALEVWGDPIAHSLSPALHNAAYAELGWDWTYGRRRVDEEAFATELAGLGDGYRGLSLTAPLKHAAFQAAIGCDRPAQLTGAVNTLLLEPGGPRGFNTDVEGLAADLRLRGIDGISRARIIGAGATATSALVSLTAVGATRVEVLARRPEAAAGLVALGERLKIAVPVRGLDAADPGLSGAAPVTVSTLAGGAAVPGDVADAIAAGGGLLYDVVYGQWPTALAAAWQRAGGTAVDGRGMLLHQAVRQIRIFATGDPHRPLPREQAVVAAMGRALMGD